MNTDTQSQSTLPLLPLCGYIAMLGFRSSICAGQTVDHLLVLSRSVQKWNHSQRDQRLINWYLVQSQDQRVGDESTYFIEIVRYLVFAAVRVVMGSSMTLGQSPLQTSCRYEPYLRSPALHSQHEMDQY